MNLSADVIGAIRVLASQQPEAFARFREVLLAQQASSTEALIRSPLDRLQLLQGEARAWVALNKMIHDALTVPAAPTTPRGNYATTPSDLSRQLR